jgi:hypothetical protein
MRGRDLRSSVAMDFRGRGKVSKIEKGGGRREDQFA